VKSFFIDFEENNTSQFNSPISSKTKTRDGRKAPKASSASRGISCSWRVDE